VGSQAAARLEAEAASRTEFAQAMSSRSDTVAVDADSAVSDVKYVAKVDRRDAEIYDRIRQDAGDTARISENTGIPQDKLDQIKDHVFHQQHDIAIGPDQVVRANFTPDDVIAELWPKAAAGTLDPDEARLFHRMMAHEYVERGLMNSGMPYRSANPAAWDPERVSWPTPEHYGAHDLAPHTSIMRGPFDHWETALKRDKMEVEIAADLSNLDSVVSQILGRSSNGG
jgi:hypothetical protein